jgi:hypothetical protein
MREIIERSNGNILHKPEQPFFFQRDVQRQLYFFVEEEEEAQREFRASRGREVTATELVESFKESEAYRELQREAREKYNPQRGEDEQELRGGVFAQLAYRFAALRDWQHGCVLSPERTLELWQKLYPQRAVVHNNYGGTSLYGVSVPDGVLITGDAHEEQIAAVYEYSLSDQTQRYIKKYDTLLESSRRYRELFPQFNFSVVTTNAGERNLKPWESDTFQIAAHPVKLVPFDHLVNTIRPVQPSLKRYTCL